LKGLEQGAVVRAYGLHVFYELCSFLGVYFSKIVEPLLNREHAVHDLPHIGHSHTDPDLPPLQNLQHLLQLSDLLLEPRKDLLLLSLNINVLHILIDSSGLRCKQVVDPVAAGMGLLDLGHELLGEEQGQVAVVLVQALDQAAPGLLDLELEH
jgi:hypothetical protein